MGWISMEAQEYKFKQEGDTLVGRLVGCKDTQYGSKAYDLEAANGEKFYFFGCTQLDNLLADCNDKIISIKFDGIKKLKNGKTMKVFDVKKWQAEDGTLPDGFETYVQF